MMKHAITETKFNAEAENALNTYSDSGWIKTDHFYVDGKHIMVFQKPQEDNTVSEDILGMFDQVAVRDVFSPD